MDASDIPVSKIEGVSYDHKGEDWTKTKYKHSRPQERKEVAQDKTLRRKHKRLPANTRLNKGVKALAKVDILDMLAKCHTKMQIISHITKSYPISRAVTQRIIDECEQDIATRAEGIRKDALRDAIFESTHFMSKYGELAESDKDYARLHLDMSKRRDRLLGLDRMDIHVTTGYEGMSDAELLADVKGGAAQKAIPDTSKMIAKDSQD